MSQNKSFLPLNISALDARLWAQHIAFGPVVFQAARLAKKKGLFEAIDRTGDIGLSPYDLAKETGLDEYVVKVICEPCVVAGLLDMVDDRYRLNLAGHFLLNDDMTEVNMDFVHDVCYEPLLHLEESLDKKRPAGLRVFGPWPNVYQGLSKLPDRVRQSWLNFDHYYSDGAFAEALDDVAGRAPRRLLDIGGNTGKWAVQVARRLPETHITIADLPGQLVLAEERIENENLTERIHGHPVDLLEAEATLPEGYDLVWMSQFLVCFSEPEIVAILKLAAKALEPGGSILILDTFWDRQDYDISAYCVANTTPYFTCVANGNSRMYRYDDLERLIAAAELEIVWKRDHLGLAHTLLEVQRL